MRLILPKEAEPLRICADYYLALYSHLIAGTLSISSALGCFRLHRGNHFSKNPVVGGPHRPGYFPDAVRKSIEQRIGWHIVENAETLSKVIGHDMCLGILYKLEASGDIHAAFRGAAPQSERHESRHGALRNIAGLLRRGLRSKSPK